MAQPAPRGSRDRLERFGLYDDYDNANDEDRIRCFLLCYPDQSEYLTRMPFAAQHIRDARNHLRKHDPVMRDIVKRVGPFTAKTRRDRFASLAGAIVAQQISAKAANSIWMKLEGLLEPDKVCAAAIDAKSLEQLRSAGVSRQKGSYLKDLSARVLSPAARQLP